MLRSSPAIDVSQQQPDIAHGSNWCKRRPTLWSDAAVCGPEEGVPFRDIAGLIGRRLSKAADHSFAHFAALDNPSSSTFTRERLGWRRVEPTLLPDLDWPRYFES
jgi:hypothetical protein